MTGPDLDLSLTTGRNESAIQLRGCFKSTLSYIFLAILIIFKETNPKFFYSWMFYRILLLYQWIVPLRDNYGNIFYLNIEQVTKNIVKALQDKINKCNGNVKESTALGNLVINF